MRVEGCNGSRYIEIEIDTTTYVALSGADGVLFETKSEFYEIH